jgi:Caspase domain
MPDQPRGLDSVYSLDNELPNGKNFLLAIAINKYQYCTPLYNAVKDVEAFIQLMTGKYQIDPTNIIYIKDTEATKQQIERSFDRLIDLISPQDNLIVYFSGHGRHHDRRGGFWIPVEGGNSDNDWPDYISNDAIKSYLSKIKSFHTFLIADSCFSGSIFIDKSKEKFTGDRRDTVPSRWGLTAGKNEIVSDGELNQHSPFAKALLDVLSHADQPPGVMRICDLVLEKVAANANQTPMGSPLLVPGHQGGQLVLYFREDEDSVWLKLSPTIDGCFTYLRRFPKGKYYEMAEKTISKYEAEKEWEVVKKIALKSELIKFEQKHPDAEPVVSGELNRLLLSLEEEELWYKAQHSNTLTEYRDYLKRSTLRKYVVDAEAAIEQIVEAEQWLQANQYNTITAFVKYLQDYPQGAFAYEAHKAISLLEKQSKPNSPSLSKTRAEQIKVGSASKKHKEEQSFTGKTIGLNAKTVKISVLFASGLLVMVFYHLFLVKTCFQ